MALCRRPFSSATWLVSATASSSCWVVLDSVLHTCLFATFTSRSNANEVSIAGVSMQSQSDDQSLRKLIHFDGHESVATLRLASRELREVE